MGKLKIAIAIGSTCMGCDMSIIDINERILELHEIADIVFWVLGADGKFADIEAMEDGEIDITLHHGTIRTEEHVHIAKLFRQKSKLMVSFGACSNFGGIPSLCNLTTPEAIFNQAYLNPDYNTNPEGILPSTESKDDGHTLTLPALLGSGLRLKDVVDVDYFIPGCPPEPPLIGKLLDVVVNYVKTGELPPKGTIIAEEKAECDECPRIRENKMVDHFYRVYEKEPDPDRCLLEQGFFCMGPATRGGCGSVCIRANMPCRGCMGPPPGVKDQGAKMMDAIASIMATEREKEMTEEEVKALIDTIPDPVGTFYRFGLQNALINHRRD